MQRTDKKSEKENGATTEAEKRPSSEAKRLLDVSETHYRRPSLVRGSAAYKKLVRHMFEEQVTRILQRGYRKKHHKEFKGKYEETLNKKDNEPVTLRPLKEPVGLKFIEHVRKILANRSEKLDFNDPEFLRDITKALRLGGIEMHDYAAASMLFEGRKIFPRIQQCPSDARGVCEKIWSPHRVTHFTSDVSYQIQLNAEKLEQRKLNYFLLHFSRKFATAFLWDWLDMKGPIKENFRQLFRCYVMHCINWYSDAEVSKLFFSINDNKRIFSLDSIFQLDDELLQVIEELNDPSKRDAAINLLKLFLEKTASGWPETLRVFSNQNRDRITIRNLIHFINAFHVQLSTVIVSPDGSDPDSNLFCLVLPHPALLEVLLKSFFNENATMPYYSIGQLSTRLIRDLDAKLKVRPVELFHPDLAPRKLTEGANLHHFLVLFHDLIPHCELNSMNRYKNLLRYIRSLFETVKGFDMSKIIWRLSDFPQDPDFFTAMLAAEKKHDIREMIFLKHEFFILELHELIKHFWSIPRQHNALILIVDMILNSNQWADLLGLPPEQFFNQAANNLKETKENKNFTDELFQKTLCSVKECVRLHPNKSREFYILICAMKKEEVQRKLIDLIFLLEQHHLILKILQWHRNGGLCFRPGLTSVANLSFENLTPDKQYENLKDAFIKRISENDLAKEVGEIAKTAEIELSEDKINYDAALSVAACKNQAKACGALLAIGANPERYDEQGYAPLHQAALNNSSDVVRLFLSPEYKIDINKRTLQKDLTAAMLAAENNHAKTLRALAIARADLQILNQHDGWGAIHYAAFYGSAEAIFILIQYGVSVNQSSRRGETPLGFAAMTNQCKVIELLLKHNANVHQLDERGHSALYYAIEGRNHAASTLLIERMDKQTHRQNQLLQDQAVTSSRYSMWQIRTNIFSLSGKKSEVQNIQRNLC